MYFSMLPTLADSPEPTMFSCVSLKHNCRCPVGRQGFGPGAYANLSANIGYAGTADGARAAPQVRRTPPPPLA